MQKWKVILFIHSIVFIMILFSRYIQSLLELLSLFKEIDELSSKEKNGRSYNQPNDRHQYSLQFGASSYISISNTEFQPPWTFECRLFIDEASVHGNYNKILLYSSSICLRLFSNESNPSNCLSLQFSSSSNETPSLFDSLSLNNENANRTGGNQRMKNSSITFYNVCPANQWFSLSIVCCTEQKVYSFSIIDIFFHRCVWCISMERAKECFLKTFHFL